MKIKRPWYYNFTWLVCLPNDIMTWMVVLLIRALFGKKLHLNNGLWCELREDSWFRKKFYMPWGGTTLGHGGFYNFDKTKGPGIDTYIEFHEHIHVEQYEAGMLRSFIIGLLVFLGATLMGQLFIGLILGWNIWAFGSIFTFGPNWLQALIRGEEAYMGSHHEEAAYAQTELKARKDRK